MIKYGNSIPISAKGAWLRRGVNPYNPLDLPPFTIRMRLADGYTPDISYPSDRTQVSSNPNIWDFTYENDDWSHLFAGKGATIREVLGANTAGVTDFTACFMHSWVIETSLFDTSSAVSTRNMYMDCYITEAPFYDMSNVVDTYGMFQWCSELTYVPDLDTSSVTGMGYMFYGCTSLTFVPKLDVSRVAAMDNSFRDCTSVSGGALALYNDASSLAVQPTHTDTFLRCGSNTTTGAAELAQIPRSWGGTR